MSCEDRCEAAISSSSCLFNLHGSPADLWVNLHSSGPSSAHTPRRSHLNVNAELIAEREESPVGGGSLRCENIGGVSSVRSPKPVLNFDQVCRKSWRKRGRGEVNDY